MSAPVPTIWTNASTASIKTGSWRTALPVHVAPPAPCHRACPVDGDIAVWIQSLKNRSYYDAWLALVENNPFPAVTGRVCHHPCESSCNRGLLDEPIAIRCLERYVGDMALEEGWALPSPPMSKAGTVAIVGGGPAGLAAAYHLRRRGYAATVFESMPELGGVLRYGIPPYRLPKEILDAEIRRILALGIDVNTNTPISDPMELASLRERFSAIFVATGAGLPKRLPQLDYAKPWVMEATSFLEQTNRGERLECGPRIVVIGGGSAAMDVARTARRHGNHVVVLCLEKEVQMPAQREEIAEAKEEGIVIDDGAMLRVITDRGADGLTLECIRVEFEAGEGPGQFEIKAVPGTNFKVGADTIVSATGQDADLTPFAGWLQVQDGLICTDELLETSLAGVFAGGDVTSLQRFVTVAFGFGKRGAIAIDQYLRSTSQDPSFDEAPVPFDAINTHYHARDVGRPPRRLVPAEERTVCFDAVELSLSDAEALAESQRCFSCGNCTFCDNCLVYCPDMAIRREDARYFVNGDYCKGCGLCVAECPTGSVVMRQEW
ncbi:MAG TPA: NAD(P)-binding protein [Woeseiaceae bacterium]|nr:NAD(P)-binding protein [Woeseiaceae bacterium]